MNYPLHTTGDAKKLGFYLGDVGREAFWVHVTSDEERQQVIDTVTEWPAWELLDNEFYRLPIYFVVGVRLSLAAATRLHLAELIRPRQQPADQVFLGALFGYDAEDVAWHIEVTRISWQSTCPECYAILNYCDECKRWHCAGSNCPNALRAREAHTHEA